MMDLGILAKSIVSNYCDDGWFGSNYTMNIYRGCNHGCIYCDSRSYCYRIDDFNIVRNKINALAIIERDLKSKRRKGIVMTGSMSDPYNELEKTSLLTRGALELIHKHHFGVVINTKSDLVCRDLDILEMIARHSPVAINITITTTDDDLSKIIEPNVCVSSQRFDIVKNIRARNIMCGIIMMPILPYLNDSVDAVADMISLCSSADAKWIYPGKHIGVTMRDGQRQYLYKAFDRHFPGLKRRYIHEFGMNKTISSPNSTDLLELLTKECNEKRILFKMEDIIRFIRSGYDFAQTTMFD